MYFKLLPVDSEAPELYIGPPRENSKSNEDREVRIEY